VNQTTEDADRIRSTMLPGVIDRVIELVLSMKVNQVIEGWKK